MKIAICDDMPVLHRSLKQSLEKYAVPRNLDFIYYEFTNGRDLLASETDFDIIFMDYCMDDIDGLETSRRLRKKNVKSAIIFLTSNQQVIFEAFEVNAYRFLVKPINEEKLFSALDDFIASLDDSCYMLLRTDEGDKKINVNDIIYTEASGKYCYIRTATDSIIYKKTLSEFETALDNDSFFRCHRSYLVNLRHIASHTSTEIIFENNERALISKTKLTSFKNAFVAYIKKNNFSKV
ncbi:MAG: response regulator transcription factor [Ruminococcus sp.]|nr:response regulator transcription factor [Ruminococcus sp.]